MIMTLDEAIDHSLDAAASITKCTECREEHRLLAVWLQDLKRLAGNNKQCPDCGSLDTVKSLTGFPTLLPGVKPAWFCHNCRTVFGQETGGC